MSETVSTKDPLRYRLYFWLMNVSLFFSLLNFTEATVELFTGVAGLGLPSEIKPVVGLPAIIFGSIMPLFLIVAKFMRDDYAEQLWQRSVAMLAYALVVLPVMFLVFSWVGYLYFEEGTWLYMIWDKLYSGIKDVGDGRKILDAAWIFFVSLFVVFFQFFRWRDSRGGD